MDDIEDIITAGQTRDFERVLQQGFPLSRKAAKKVASLLATDLRDAGASQSASRDESATTTDELSELKRMGVALRDALKGSSRVRGHNPGN